MKERELVHHFPILVADEAIPPEEMINQVIGSCIRLSRKGETGLREGRNRKI